MPLRAIFLSRISPKLQKLAIQLTYLPRTLRLIWSAAPAWTAAWIVLLVVQGILPAASIYLTRRLVDSLAAALGQGVGWQTIAPTLWAGLLMVAVFLLAQVAQGMAEWVRVGQAEYVTDYFTRLVHEKATAADLAHYESPEYRDRLFQAIHDLKSRPLGLLESCGYFVQVCITLAAVAALLLPYGLWLPLVLVVAALPAFTLLLHFNRLYYRWWHRTTTDRRWANYYDVMLTLDSVAGEVRLFDLGKWFQTRYEEIRVRLRHDRLRLTRQRGLAALGAGLFAGIMTGAAMGWMVWQAFLGRVTLGDVALFYQALNKGQSLLDGLRTSIGQINSNLLFLSNLFAFLALEPTIVDPPFPRSLPSSLREGIRFRQVSFRYPGSKAPVLENFDFFVPAGKIVAIVGANGAGKSTLVKLLCRLYDPDAGSVEYDGIDVRQVRVAELRRMVTGMFQLPVHYFSSVAENIGMGNVAESLCMQEIRAAAQRAGAEGFILRLPDGYETLLGKYFPQGTELSGGEWQRLALARSFYRQAAVMVLDEPTSSLDSWSEIDWFDRLRSLAAGRTTILITHRLTIAKQADVIHVMEAGRMVESGTHAQLVAQGGRYADSWRAQMQEKSPVHASGQNGQYQGWPANEPAI